MTVGAAREALETVYAARLRPPANATRLARLAYGVGLPLAVLRAVLDDPGARRRYLRVCAAQAAVALIAGVLLGVSWEALSDATDSLDILVSFNPRSGVEVSATRDAAAVAIKRGIAFWSSLYATLCVVEWIVIALSRRHHDAISRDAALLTGVPPEDPPLTPRVCVDLPWVGRRIKRYIRGLKVFAAGTPALALLYAIPALGGELYSVATVLWAAYWLVVLVTAKSAHAWKEEGSAPAPWFVRGWDRLTASVPGFRWAVPRAYGRFLRNFTSSMSSPAARWERSPWELCGVALARILGGLPGMYMFLRPLIPVASQHVLIGQDRRRQAAAETSAGAGAGAAAEAGADAGAAAEAEAGAEAEAAAEAAADTVADAGPRAPLS